MRKYVIPEKFFKDVAGKGKLYSRIWWHWLSEFVDEIFEPDFLEKQQELLIKYFQNKSEIREIYEFGVQLLQQDFEILDEKKKKGQITKQQIENATEIIEYLNEKADTMFRCNSTNIKLVVSRINEGFTIDNFKVVVDKKVKDWKGTDWQMYLRPITLFSKTKFENYLNENNAKPTKSNFSKFADSVAKAQSITFRTDK